MDHLIVDTCVWLDIAMDARLAPVLDVLDGPARSRSFALVVPDLVVQEFERNRESVQQRTKKVYETLIKDAREIAHVLTNQPDRDELHRSLGKVTNALPAFRGELSARMTKVRSVLTGTGVRAQASTEAMMARALERGLSKKAPFVRGKNSCGDSLLLEHFDQYARSLVKEDRCVLVTSNKQDFSAMDDDNRVPHPDIAPLFTEPQRLFSINIAEYLKGLDTVGVTTAVVEAAREAADRSLLACPSGGEHDFDPQGGANLRSRYGGLTWHLFCRKCGAQFDTGDAYGD